MPTLLTRYQRRLLVILLCAPLFGLLGVIAAEAIPDGRIAEHLLHGQQAGILTRDRGRPRTPLDTRTQAATECLAFSVGLGDQPERNHVTTALVSPIYVEGGGLGQCEMLDRNLRVFESTGRLPPGTTYLRYWHGYAVLTRPALGLFGVAGTRWIAFVLLAVAVSAMAFAVSQAFGFASGAILVAPTLLTTDTIIGAQSATTAIGVASAWIGGWMSFALVSRRSDWRTAALVAALAGALCAYVDLLTTMPGAYALTVVGATLGAVAAKGAAALRDGWRVAAAAAIGWVAGLIWMWVSKWVIAAITVGVDEVTENIRSRANLYLSDGRRTDSSRIQGLTDNLGSWWHTPLTPWVVMGIVGVLVVAAVRGRGRSGVVGRSLLCATVAALPVLGWYLALSQHSQFHAFLVYRSIPMTFGAVAALLLVGLTTALERPSGAYGSISAEELDTPLITEATVAETSRGRAESSTR